MEETLTVRLDAAAAKELAEEARRTKQSRGQIVREALRQHLQRERPNARQALGKLVGSIDGPPDLSTNKTYLAGLGRRRA